MRTTVILDDTIYEKLVKKALANYGSVKTLSKTLNSLLAKAFEKEALPESMFGAWKGEKGLSLKGWREEGEPH